MSLKLLPHYLGIFAIDFTLFTLAGLRLRWFGLCSCCPSSLFKSGCLLQFNRRFISNVFDFLNVDVPFFGDLVLGHLKLLNKLEYSNFSFFSLDDFLLAVFNVYFKFL